MGDVYFSLNPPHVHTFDSKDGLVFCTGCGRTAAECNRSFADRLSGISNG